MKTVIHNISSVILILSALIGAFSSRIYASVNEVPSVSAESAVLIEASDGGIIFEKSAYSRMAMASTTKIMTALIALEKSDLDRAVCVSSEAVGVEGSSIYLHDGEKLTVRQLVYATMLESANDAAAALACEIAGSTDAFADLMNERAVELGLQDTHFTNPHGLYDDAHYTTAFDLAMLTRAALENDDFREVVSTYKTTIPLDGGDGTRVLQNHNKLLKFYPDAIGVKTGYTKKSGRCLVSAAMRDGVTLIAVTLDAPDDWNDHKAMLDYGFSMYERREIAVGESICVDVPVIGGECETVCAVNYNGFAPVMRRDAPEITRTVELRRFYTAPVKAGDYLGRVLFYNGGEVVGEVGLYAKSDVVAKVKPGFFERLFG